MAAAPAPAGERGRQRGWTANARGHPRDADIRRRRKLASGQQARSKPGIPVADILGNTVTAIAIRLPGSFSAVASVALGWLTCFIACVGIVFVLPMFWFDRAFC